MFPGAAVLCCSLLVQRPLHLLFTVNNHSSYSLDQSCSNGDFIHLLANMFVHDSVYWRAPLSMVGAISAGVLLILGHHLFYQSLAGSEIPTAYHGAFGVSKQKLNTSAGTAFAFLVKACFAYSLSVAYAQLVWRSIKHQRTELARLDALFSIIKNATLLADYSLWLKFPVLLSIALSVW